MNKQEALNKILELQYQSLEEAVRHSATIQDQQLVTEIEALITSYFGGTNLVPNVYPRIERIKNGTSKAEQVTEQTAKVGQVEYEVGQLTGKDFLNAQQQKKNELDAVKFTPSTNTEKIFSNVKKSVRINEDGTETPIGQEETTGEKTNELPEEAEKIARILQGTDQDILVRYNGYAGIVEFAKELGEELPPDEIQEGIQLYRRLMFAKYKEIVKNAESND